MEYRPIDVSDAHILKQIFDYEEYEIYFAEKGSPISKWEYLIQTYYQGTDSYIVYDRECPVGWLMYSLEGAVCNLDIVVLLPEERGKGYGRKIFDDLVKQRMEIKEIRLDVQQRNTRAVDFYMNYGFTNVAEEFQYVGNERVLYKKLLLQVRRP